MYIVAHVWSDRGYPICWRHSLRSREVTNQNFFFKNDLFSFMRARHVLSNYKYYDATYMHVYKTHCSGFTLISDWRDEVFCWIKVIFPPLYTKYSLSTLIDKEKVYPWTDMFKRYQFLRLFISILKVNENIVNKTKIKQT